MVECKELVGKVIQKVTIYEDGDYGPEITIDFTDDTEFTFCVSNRPAIEAKFIRTTTGEPIVLRDYAATQPLVAAYEREQSTD